MDDDVQMLYAFTGDELICFLNTVSICLTKEDMVSEFNRLSGCTLGVRQKGVIGEIDLVTGYQDAKDYAEMGKFVQFVKDCVWDRLSPETKTELMKCL